jgi:hypothetical protein
MLKLVKCEDLPFGVREYKGLRGFPEGKTRVRMRAGQFAKVFVKTENGVREFTPTISADGYLVCDSNLEMGNNQHL